MAKLTREVKIEWKINPSYFNTINSKVLTMPVKRIGSAVTSVNKMLIRDEMMRTLMPTMLGIDPTSQTSNWTREVSDYWHSLSVEVPESGLIMNTSLLFDIGDSHPIRSKYIKKLLNENKDIKTSEDMVKALTDKSSKLFVSEDNIYKYAEPENIDMYLLWIYCQGYRSVSNSLGDINKSHNIDFYMYSTEDRKNAKRDKSLVAINAMKALVGISSNPEDMRNVLLVLLPTRGREVISMADADVTMELHTILTSRPADILKTIEDKNLKTRALIAKYLASNLIKNLVNTSTYVDNIDQTMVLGYTIEEVIVFFNSDSPDNKKYLSELNIRYKQTIK